MDIYFNCLSTICIAYEVMKTNSWATTNNCLLYFIHLPMKMEPIVSSETSAIRTRTPGNYPKRNKLQLLISSQGYVSSVRLVFGE